MTAWLSAFVFTQLVEIPIYLLWFRRDRCSVLRAFGASALSHPMVWFGFFHPGLALGYYPRVVGAEMFAWLGEAVYFRRYGLRRALLASFVANAASLAVGLLSRWLFGWP